MAEYVKSVPFESLIEHLDKKEPCKNCYHKAACDAWVRNATTLYDDYIYSVKNCPYYKSTADVVEVVYGEWKSVLVKFGASAKTYVRREKCSICGNLETKQSDYCPRCGAKMKIKSEETVSNESEELGK